MSTRAVSVPAESILAFLRERGFTEREQRSAEIVYERGHKEDKRFRVVVYTSVRKGAARARGVGKDAIRVCAIYDDGTSTRGLGKWPRVHRTGSVGAVLERMLERMRLAYDRCSEARRREPTRASHDRARCAPPIVVAPGSDLERVLAPYFDGVQQKHHPGSAPHGSEIKFGEHYPEDDLDGEDS